MANPRVERQLDLAIVVQARVGHFHGKHGVLRLWQCLPVAVTRLEHREIRLRLTVTGQPDRVPDGDDATVANRQHQHPRKCIGRGDILAANKRRRDEFPFDKLDAIVLGQQKNGSGRLQSANRVSICFAVLSDKQGGG
jgi:hypothetical protein